MVIFSYQSMSNRLMKLKIIAKKLEEEPGEVCPYCEETGNYFCGRCINKKKTPPKEKKEDEKRIVYHRPPKNWS